PRAGRRHRPRQGRPVRLAELVVNRFTATHDRGARVGDSRRKEGTGLPGRWPGRHGRDVLIVRPSVRRKGPAAHAAGPFSLWSTPCTPEDSKLSTQDRPATCGAVTQRKVKVSSIVIWTETGCPMRVPGTNRHCRAALAAS